MRKTFYRLFFIIMFSLLIVSCGDGDDGDTPNTGTTNTDCVLGTSKIGDCTI